MKSNECGNTFNFLRKPLGLQETKTSLNKIKQQSQLKTNKKLNKIKKSC